MRVIWDYVILAAVGLMMSLDALSTYAAVCLGDAWEMNGVAVAGSYALSFPIYAAAQASGFLALIWYLGIRRRLFKMWMLLVSVGLMLALVVYNNAGLLVPLHGSDAAGEILSKPLLVKYNESDFQADRFCRGPFL